MNVYNIYILIKILFGLSGVSTHVLVPATASPVRAKSFQRMRATLRLCTCCSSNDSSGSRKNSEVTESNPPFFQ